MRRTHENLGRQIDDNGFEVLVSDIVAAYQHPDVENAMATEDCSSEQHRVANMLWYERAGLDRDLAEAACAMEFDPETHPVYPDSRGVLSQLHASGVRIAVVSNFHRDIRLALADHGLAEFADAVVTSSEHGFQKPDPRMFSVALGLLDVDAADALMAGDSAPNDGAAAAIGIDTLILPMPAEADVSHRGLDVVVRLVGADFVGLHLDQDPEWDPVSYRRTCVWYNGGHDS